MKMQYKRDNQEIFPMIFDCKSEGRGALKANTK